MPRPSPESPGPPFWLHFGSLWEPFGLHLGAAGPFFPRPFSYRFFDGFLDHYGSLWGAQSTEGKRSCGTKRPRARRFMISWSMEQTSWYMEHALDMLMCRWVDMSICRYVDVSLFGSEKHDILGSQGSSTVPDLWDILASRAEKTLSLIHI